MSTDLNSRSKAYELLRVSMRGSDGGVGLVVSTGGYNGQSHTFSIPAITQLFAEDEFYWVQRDLNLLDETMDRLKLDMAQFALSGGKGMEAY